MTVGRILKREELGVEGNLFLIRNGRPPREGEIADDAELVEAGYRKPAPEPWTPGEPGPTAAELIEDPTAAMRREIRGYEQELEYVMQGGQTHGEQSVNRAAGLRNHIAHLRDAIAAAETAE